MQGALAVGDDGTAGTPGELVIDVPTGKKFYMTAIYGIATAPGTIHVFDSATGEDIDALGADSNVMMSLYITVNGDGGTGFVVGPFDSDVYVASDTAVTANEGEITIAGYLE